MDPQRILEIANTIRSSDIAEKNIHFKVLYPEFVEKYPTLFRMACDQAADLSHLATMCKLLTTEDNEAATVKVGQMLFDDFVKPVLPSEPKKRKRDR
jgi:hypothetical protein